MDVSWRAVASPIAALAALGTYRVVLTVDGEEFLQIIRIERDPVLTEAVPGDDQPAVDEEEQEQERELEMQQEKELELRDIDRSQDIGI